MGAPFGSSGSKTDQTNGIMPITKLDGTGTIYGTATPLPYTAASTDPTRFNGQGVGYNQFHTPVPKIYQWNLAFQRELGTNSVFELAYVASHGFNLNFPTDLNQVPESKLSTNDTADRPYPVYQGIGGSTNNAISNYNSLQASVTKRLTSGISMSFNYVWSHFLDDQDSSGWGSRSGPQNFQNGSNPSLNYGNSNFDVRNAFKGYIVYQLPFGKGKMFLNHNTWLDEAIGGWEVSSTILLSSGQPFAVFSSGNDYSQAGRQYPNVVRGVNPTAGYRKIGAWFNPGAFSLPANGTYGDAQRNAVYGPGIEQVNISAGKSFKLPWEGLALRIRADASNAFNHPSFSPPGNVNLSGAAGVGQPFTNQTEITSTTVGGRNVQLGARLSF